MLGIHQTKFSFCQYKNNNHQSAPQLKSLDRDTVSFKKNSCTGIFKPFTRA